MATRILYVITKANWGGAQHYVYDLACAAHHAGHEVTVAVGGTGLLTEKLRSASIPVIELPLRQGRTFISDLLTFGSLFSLIRIFRKVRPDVVHLNSAKAGGLGGLVARLCGVPRIIFTAHGWEFNAPRSSLSKIGIRLFSWFTILLSHTTICVSNAIQLDVSSLPGAKKKLVVIYNGVADTPLLRREEARLLLSPHTTASYWIGMISELHPTKRIADALRAFSLISEHHPEASLFIMGEGKERTALTHLIHELHLEKRIMLLGHVKDAPQYLRAFDLFIHSSQSEAFSLAILEAGCASLPVIATRVGGIPEIISDEKEGLLVPPRHPEILAQKMELLIQDPNRAKSLGEALCARVQDAFSKERMVAGTLALY